MAYEKTTWQTGDTVTAEKLNNIENGIEDIYTDDSPIFVLTQNTDTSALSKTYAEIASALTAHKACFIFVQYIEEEVTTNYSYFVNATLFDPDANKFIVEAYDPESSDFLAYLADTENDYPALE